MLYSSAWAGIAGSAHDFSSATWNAGTTEICITCHTPHNAIADQDPLWNHEVTATAFTLYSSSSGTLDATPGQPGGISKLCLSCHDGTVALDAYGGAAGSVTNKMTGSAVVGTDLSNDHPVSFTYDTDLVTTDGGLFEPTTTDSGLGGTIDVDLLFSAKLECASCHDVHNQGLSSTKLLRIDNASSALCLTCHNK